MLNIQNIDFYSVEEMRLFTEELDKVLTYIGTVHEETPYLLREVLFSYEFREEKRIFSVYITSDGFKIYEE